MKTARYILESIAFCTVVLLVCGIDSIVNMLF